jgi:pSer/pThr/pTyr-binding forkhead associated (FHA) protein
MDLREYHKKGSKKSQEDQRQDSPGPFLLINWPVEENPWNRRLIPLQEGSETIGPKECLIGRVSACHIAIQEAGISSRHALLQRASPNVVSRWTLVDLCSTNGTYTEQTRLVPTEPESLENGQNFLLGTEVQVCYLTFEGLQDLLQSADSGTSDPVPSNGQDNLSKTTIRFNRGRLNEMMPKAERGKSESFSGGSTMHMTTPLPWPRTNSDSNAALASASDSGSKQALSSISYGPPVNASYWLNVEGHEPQALSSEKPFILGRAANGTDLRLNHPLVSRRHVRLTVEKGKVFVEDMGSSNGTVVGTYDITGKKVSLDGQHSFWIGPFCLKVTSDKVVEEKANRATFTTHLRLKLSSKASMGIYNSGEISLDMPVLELLQGIEFNEKSGTLFIEGFVCQGLMSFRSGKPKFAECHGDGGVLRGADAIYKLLAVNDGEFNFAREVDDSDPNVSISVTGAIFEFSRLQDEEAANQG